MPTSRSLIGDGLSAAAVHAQVPSVLGPLLRRRPIARLERRAASWRSATAASACSTTSATCSRASWSCCWSASGRACATAKSLSAYVALRPRTGQTDADRNLISNIHDGGTPAAEGARRLLALLDAIRAAGRSGVTVKEPSEPANAGALTS